MKYRRFGKTELEVPVFTLGLMRYMKDDPDESAGVVHRAVELGINHLETARGYGTSEQLLGHALRGIDRDSVIVTTKIGPQPTYDEFMRAFDDSMKRMGLDRLDNLDIHGINNPRKLKMATDPKGTWRAVGKLMDQKVVDHIGFSTHGSLEIILETIDTELFESVNLHYYYFMQTLWPAVVRARQLDMGVFIISPNDKGGMLFDPPQRLRDLSVPFDPMHLASRWLLAKPEVHTLSLGAEKLEDFDLHMETADNDGPLSHEEEAAIGRWDAQWGKVLADDYCTVCGQCLPCPEFIDVPNLLRLRNMACAFDMHAYGRYRYNMLNGSDDWFQGWTGDHCTECGECLPRCPEKLAIPRLLFDVHDMLKSEPGRRLWG